MTKVFVTGSTGLLGQALVDKLLASGFSVVALVHKNINIQNHINLNIITGDVTNLDSFKNQLAGVEIIFHLAGVVTDWAPAHKYFDVHVQGTKNIISAAINNKIKKIIYVSTIDVFAHENYEIVNENLPYTNSTVPYRKSKLSAHHLIVEAGLRGDINPIILCPSWIFGPRDKIFIAELVKQLKNNNFVFVGKKDNFTPLVYTENIATLMVNLSEKNVEPNNCVFLVSDINITWNELIKNISEKIKVKVPKMSIPYHLAYFVGMLMEYWGALLHNKNRPLLTRTAVETIGRSIKVDTTKICNTFGYKSLINFEKGLDLTLKTVRDIKNS